VNKVARRCAKEERRKAALVQEAFDGYLDLVAARLERLGVPSEVAIDAIFHTVEHLGAEGTLPLFPEGNVEYQAMGRWLVAADDFGFADFVVEAVSE